MMTDEPLQMETIDDHDQWLDVDVEPQRMTEPLGLTARPYIWWRGKRFSPQMRDAIKAAEQRAGFKFTITQGGFNSGDGAVAASAGTHDGDAADFSVREMTESEVAVMIEALRWSGIAAWLRTQNEWLWGVRPHNFKWVHVHGVPNGWGYPSEGARQQAAAYRRGRDGLLGNGADAGGPGHTSAYRSKTRPERPDTRTDIERLMDTMDATDLKKIITSATDHIPGAVLNQRIAVVRGDTPTTRTLGTLVESHDAALNRIASELRDLRSQMDEQES